MINHHINTAPVTTGNHLGRSNVRQYKIPIINLPQLGKWSQASTQSVPVGTAGNKLE